MREAESSSRSPEAFDLAGKVVIVTGGARGMGRAHVESCVAGGAKVLVTDVLDDVGGRLCRSLPADRATYLHADVSDESHWDRVLDVAQSRFGRIDGLVNNAGVLVERGLSETSIADFNHVISVNQVGVFLGMRAAAPVMIAGGGGSIVNISSVGGLVGFRDCFAYVASKYAVRGMSRAAALELALSGVRVNTVFPGDTLTPMIEGSTTGAVPAPDAIPMARYGLPTEIASAVRFLLSDASSFITGAELAVDGGYTAQ